MLFEVLFRWLNQSIESLNMNGDLSMTNVEMKL